MHRDTDTSGFGDVDATGRPERFAGYLQDASAVGSIAAGKSARAELMELRPGSRAIDVGCGLGDDARTLGALVAPDGEVIGLDSSAALLDRARARLRPQDGPCVFVQGDAHELPFEADTFDAARIERTLQHLVDPAIAASELARVTRAGGIVLACEPDWGTIAVTGAPRALVQAMSAAAERRIRNPWIGRNLAGVFLDAGLTAVAVRAEALVLRDFATLQALTDLPQLAATMRDDGHEGVDQLIAAIERDGYAGRLVVALTLFTVTARVAD